MNYDKQWTIAYLNEVLSLETEIYSTKALMEYLESIRIPIIDVPEKFVPPNKPARPSMPKTPSMRAKPNATPASVLTGAVAWTQELLEERALLAGVMLLIAGIFAAFWFGSLWLILLLPLLGVGGAYIVCFTIGLFVEQANVEYDKNRYNTDLSDHRAQIQQNQLEYENHCRNILAAYKERCEALQQAFIERKNESLVNNQLAFLFNKEINSAKLLLEAQLIVVNTSLKNLHGMNVLYPKYRNLVAVSSIAEYLDSGRCDHIEGTNGAYNIYERELRLERITDKLDVIIEKLDQIKEMQYKLFIELSRANENLATIKSSISDGFQVLQAQAKANTHRFLELSDDVAQVNFSMKNCFRDVEKHLTKLENANDKALAYLRDQK